MKLGDIFKDPSGIWKVIGISMNRVLVASAEDGSKGKKQHYMDRYKAEYYINKEE